MEALNQLPPIEISPDQLALFGRFVVEVVEREPREGDEDEETAKDGW